MRYVPECSATIDDAFEPNGKKQIGTVRSESCGEGFEMKPSVVSQWKGLAAIVLAIVLVLAMTSVAAAGLIREGNGKSIAYAPYTAGPVVREVPFAAYTEVPYAPYTAGPVVREQQRVFYKLPLK
jgi:hypothetical protein